MGRLSFTSGNKSSRGFAQRSRVPRAERPYEHCICARPHDKFCLVAGGDYLGNRDGIARILETARNNFAPEAAGASHQQVMRSTRYPRTDQSINEYIVELDLLGRKAESKMETDAGFPGQFVSILRVGEAGLPRREESLVMASSHKSFKFDVAAANVRWLFG